MPDSLTSVSTTTSVVLLATTPTGRLSCADGTLLDRITGQLAALPISDVQVVTAGGGLGADLRGIAKIARASAEAVAVLPADVVAHTEALAMLLEHPAHDTRALVHAGVPDGPTRPPLRSPVRIEGGKIMASGSSFHTVPEANATFAGVLQAGVSDLPTLADIAEELADLADAGRLGPVTPVEAVDLLLVGLVRSGVRVRAAALGELHCDRVTGQDAADSAVRRLADVDEAQVRLDSAVKSNDGFFTTFFVSPWSRHLIRPAAALKLTPNAVTGISVGLAALSAVWFSAGTLGGRLAGAVLLYLSFVLDCLDGQLARYTRGFSPLGAWADGMADRLKEYVVYVGLAYGYVAVQPFPSGNPHGIWFLAAAAMILQSVRHALHYSYTGAIYDAGRVGALWAKPVRSLLEPSDAGRRRVPRQGVLRLAQRLERESVAHWLRKAIVLPIGERMALIAVTTVVFDARVTFLALLGWGSFAALYQLAGRIVRSAE